MEVQPVAGTERAFMIGNEVAARAALAAGAEMFYDIFHLFPGLCKGCGLCIEKCPVDTIGWSDELAFLGTPAGEPGHEEPCIAYHICELVCPDMAIRIEDVGERRSRPLQL